MKERKKSSKQRLTPHTPHTRSKLHNIHTLIHQNFIHKYHPCHQINQSTKLPILDFYSSLIAVPKHQASNAYLSPDQDEPGLTRLTRNTDWAFSSTKSEKTKKSTFSANAFDSTKPRNLISFNTLTHPSPIFIILQNVVRFTSNE